jgi:hypothetical protein
MPVALTAGDTLVNKDGVEADYFTAVPTLVHGALHILKSAQGYVYRLTGDLESEFSKKGEPQTLAESQTTTVSDPSVMAELAELKAMFAKVMEGRSENAPAPVVMTPIDEDQDTDPTDESPTAPVVSTPVIGAASPAPVETPVAPATVTPPANAIAY